MSYLFVLGWLLIAIVFVVRDLLTPRSWCGRLLWARCDGTPEELLLGLGLSLLWGVLFGFFGLAWALATEFLAPQWLEDLVLELPRLLGLEAGAALTGVLVGVLGVVVARYRVRQEQLDS